MKTNQKYWVYLAAAVMLAATLACGASFGGGNRSSNQPESIPESGESGSGNQVIVTESEFDVRFSPAQVAAGEVTFVVRNEGQTPHDFRIRGNGVDHKTPTIQPGDSETFTVTLEPGTYDYKCTIEGHAMLGMEGSFTVE